MSNKRKHTFDQYRKNREEDTKEKVRSALRIVMNSSYSNVTKLSKDVAKIINEMALKDYELDVAKNPNMDIKPPKPISNTTLLRPNTSYRQLLDIHMNGQPAESEEPSVTEVEFLKITIGNLKSQNEILKNKLMSVDIPENPLALEHSSEDADYIKELEENQILLVHMIESMMAEIGDLFPIKPDGMYDYTDKKVLDITELERYKEITEKLKRG